MPVTLHVTPLDEHNSAAPLTTPRPWPPIAITALSELADLQNNRSRAFAHQDVTCSSLLQAARAWPPRSYSCSFCKREFSSAQALGGHMNVHRRDRARLRRPSPPRSADIKDHSAAPIHLPPLPSQQVALSDYLQSRSISLLYPVFSDSLSSKLMFPTVPFLVSTSPFMPNSSSPALVSDPSHSSCPIDSSTSTSSATLPRPAAGSFPRPTPQSLSQAASNSLNIPLDGQTIAAQNCPPSSHVDKKCPCPSDHSIIHLKSESTRKKSVGFQPYRSLSFKDLDDSLHAPSRSDTIGLDLELRLG